MARAQRTRVTYSEGKLTELMLYIAKKTENDPMWDQIKFNKALFFSDFSFFASTGAGAGSEADAPHAVAVADEKGNYRAQDPAADRGRDRSPYSHA